MICLISPKFTAFIISIVLVVSLILSAPHLTEKVFAQQQQQPPQQQPNVRPPQQQRAPFSNLTASIPLAPSLFEVLKSKIKISIAQAIENVTKSLGRNSTTISASFQVVNGFLVYRLAVLDSANNIHIMLVDPANGRILLQNVAERAEPFSFIPGAGSLASAIPPRMAGTTSTLPRQQQQQQQQATTTGGPFPFIP
jgi:hypothetical protein